MTKEHNSKESKKKTVPSVFDLEKKTNELSILVVDDNEGVRNIMNVYLSRYGHKVKVVDNGADAIGLIMNEDFDLVLTNLIMPNVSGFNVIKCINMLDKRPKIGLVTGSSEKFKAVVGDSLNVDFIIKKPFSFSEIAKNINTLFETS